MQRNIRSLMVKGASETKVMDVPMIDGQIDFSEVGHLKEVAPLVIKMFNGHELLVVSDITMSKGIGSEEEDSVKLIAGEASAVQIKKVIQEIKGKSPRLYLRGTQSGALVADTAFFFGLRDGDIVSISNSDINYIMSNIALN